MELYRSMVGDLASLVCELSGPMYDVNTANSSIDKFVTPPPMRSPSPPAELSASPTPDGGIRPFSDIALLPSPTPQADVDFEFFESLLKAPNKIQSTLVGNFLWI